ncbi:MAG: transposase [Rhodocyclaceae bacterium]|nr:transposase [Rhodocyclaceae bacterium]
MSFDLLSAECFESVKHDPLARVDRLIDWALLVEIARRAVPTRGECATGRPAYELEQMVRVVALKLIHLASSNVTIDGLRRRLDWRLFARFGLIDPIPEVSTLNRFCRAVEQTDALTRILYEIRRSASRHGLKLVPSKRHPAPEPRLTRGFDGDNWTLGGVCQPLPHEPFKAPTGARTSTPLENTP